jgi:hypothetical protein
MTSEDAGDRVLSGEIWDAFVGHVASMKELVVGPGVPDTPLHRAEGFRYLLRYLSAGIAMCVEHDDTEHPEIGTLIENRRSWGLDNPDTRYGFCRLAPDAAYVIRGDPGTACALELQVNTGHFADGDFAGWKALSRLADAELVREADGSVEIAIAPDRPAAAANWMATGPDASYLHVREYFGDWAAERPSRFALERVGATYPAGPLTTHALADRMELLGLWLTVGARCWWDLGRGFADGEPGPITPFRPPDSATGLGGQAYGMGAYACGPDEAVILEVVPPQARYWSFSLATWFWESADIADRQCSINHTQAELDDDGAVRVVIAQRDPGVANWLDAAGYERGTLAVRYLHADHTPTVAYRTVPFDRVPEELSTTTRWVTPDERAESIRARRAALTHRYGR